MKKFVKYLGVTAAMLLTTAPLVAPIETTTVQAYTDSNGNLIRPDASYTDNGDGTYTLHGIIHANIWTAVKHAHPTGNALDVSLDGIKVNSKGIVKLDAPKFAGYKNISDGYYQLDLDDDGRVYIDRSLMYEPANETTVNANKKFGVPYSTTVTLTEESGTYDDTGLPITKPGTKDFVNLPAGSTWKVDRKMYMYDETYYRVGTNVWIDSRSTKEKDAGLGVVTTKWNSALFTKDGQKINNRALAGNTSWLTDQTATINGKTMYRVATNEWLSSYDVK